MSHRVARREPAALRARTRSAGRRHRADELLPPAQRALLRLQQTAGNAAASSLLRQPAPAPAQAPRPSQTWLDFFHPLAELLEEWQVRAEVEEGKARHAALKAQHERRLKEIEERERPHVFKSEGVESTTRVGKSTAGLLQAALAESRVLRPYIKGKLKTSAIPGKVKIHDSDAEFEYSFEKLNEIKDSPAAIQAQARKVRGFYHRKSGTIHLRPGSNLGHALHEAIHKLASPAFFNFYGSFWEEGVCQYFTDRVLEEQGLPAMKSHLYGTELGCAKRLVAFTSHEVVAEAYFVNHTVLLNQLTAKLRLDRGTIMNLAQQGKLCDRLP
jgi:hypothetical protein